MVIGEPHLLGPRTFDFGAESKRHRDWRDVDRCPIDLHCLLVFSRRGAHKCSVYWKWSTFEGKIASQIIGCADGLDERAWVTSDFCSGRDCADGLVLGIRGQRELLLGSTENRVLGVFFEKIEGERKATGWFCCDRTGHRSGKNVG